MSATKRRVESLSDYIARIGQDKFSEKYRVSARAARSYFYNERRPRYEIAARIVESPDSKVTWASIYSPEQPLKRGR